VDATIHLDNLQDFGAILQSIRRCLGSNPLTLFKDDVSKAYQCMPTHPLWQIKQIITIGGQRHIDRCLVIGGRTSGHIWCTFMALVIWMAIHIKGIKDILHYVDNVWSYDPSWMLQRYDPYNELYPPKQVALLKLWDNIGLSHSKTSKFSEHHLSLSAFWLTHNQ